MTKDQQKMSNGMKQHQKHIESIMALIRTRDEQEFVQEAVSMLERSVNQPTTFGKIIQSRVPEHCAHAMNRVFEDEALKGNTEQLRKFLETLKKSIGAMRVLTLDIAFSPSEKDIDAINSWVVGNVGSDVVLDFTHDATIGGGAKIMFEGRYTEKTLDRKIEQVFEKERERILQTIL